MVETVVSSMVIGGEDGGETVENGNLSSDGKRDTVSKERVGAGKNDTWKLTKKVWRDSDSSWLSRLIIWMSPNLDHVWAQTKWALPLPLLFMRTIIQAIDAFPKLVSSILDLELKSASIFMYQNVYLFVTLVVSIQVDFVIELLSKLVSKQELELLVCSEDRVPGSVACLAFDA
ncbi:hypothetical protein Tco_0729261 [Tanacetum coccineum]|uniref:Uncharacterized protein n=1 Tax=Tanacetum coccineum TaxID=301880 RepID=A0ABQ4YNX5_9ASTR